MTRTGWNKRGTIAIVVTAAMGLGACSGDAKSEATPRDERAPAVTKEAAFSAFGSIGQATVTDAPPSSRVVVVNGRNEVEAKGTTDDHGSFVAYDLEPGDGYTMRVTDGDDTVGTDEFRVLAPDDPVADNLYDQKLQAGLNYVTMRDGIELAVTVRLPAGADLSSGQYPTVIEYSGYAVAAPHDLLTSLAKTLVDPDAEDDPLAPSSATAVGSVLAPMLGYVAVSVQMRGSGCSGGAYDLFGLPTTYDGYDIVETVAAQPWVKGGKVGMVGISYSGISQLFVAGTRPPHLAAIAPMSVTDDLYRGVGYPGGIFNNGFAKSWLTERIDDAKAAPEGGQEWAKLMIESGDKQCEANQLLHRQARDGLAILEDTEFREPRLFRYRSPGEWFAKSDVPTFLIGGLQDEQVSSHWVEMLSELSGRPDTWATLYSGRHNDALAPRILIRWIEFLDLFVADRVPSVPPLLRSIATALFEEAADAKAEPLPETRFRGETDLDAARERFRADPQFRVLLDNGAGPLGPGSLQPTWELAYDSWPPPDTAAQRWFLDVGGKLSGTEPAERGDDTYTSDPSVRPATNVSEDGPEPAFDNASNDWTPLVEGDGLGYVSDPLADDVVIAGSSSLDLRVAASAQDADLQVTLTEVRPDGEETFVSAGWLRLSHRKIDPKRSTETDPLQTHLKRDAQPLTPDDPVAARIEIFPVVHAFRAGSRIRVTLSAPGGELPEWKFETIETGSTKVRVVLGGKRPSALVLPVVTGAAAGAPRPPCNVLRGQPCRPYVPAANGG